jgi:hypothetical protein
MRVLSPLKLATQSVKLMRLNVFDITDASLAEP